MILSVLPGYARPDDKISELIRKQLIIPLKNGLYVGGPETRLIQPESFLLANHLRNPSYVSVESALSYWGLIPEKVFETSSVTTKRSKIFHSKPGKFSFAHLPLPYFSFGQVSMKLRPSQYAIIANPEKALCDKIVLTAGLIFRSQVQLRAWLFEDMRMEKVAVAKFDAKLIREWSTHSPKGTSMKLLAKIIEQL